MTNDPPLDASSATSSTARLRRNRRLCRPVVAKDDDVVVDPAVDPTEEPSGQTEEHNLAVWNGGDTETPEETTEASVAKPSFPTNAKHNSNENIIIMEDNSNATAGRASTKESDGLHSPVKDIVSKVATPRAESAMKNPSLLLDNRTAIVSPKESTVPTTTTREKATTMSKDNCSCHQGNDDVTMPTQVAAADSLTSKQASSMCPSSASEQQQQQQQEQEAKNEYKVGCIVYKKFEPHWYFGFISKVFPEEGWYKVFYEDGDAEDVDADELDRTAVRWESGQLAHINTTEDDLDAEPPTFQLRDDYQHPTGTSDIILQQPELFGSLDRDFLNKYIEKRLYQDRYGKDDAPGKPLFPLYPLGTIVYMYFQPEWFFGYVALIDVNTQLYGVDYEDGDREELSQQEISDAVVVLRGNVATTSITPQALSREDWLQQPLALRSVEFPGSLSIVNHNTLFSCLDREALDEYIADRCYPNKKKRAKEKQLSRTRAKHRINSSTDQSVNVDEYTAECHRPTKKQKSRPQKRAKPGIAMSTVESVDVKVKGRFSEAVLNFFRLMHERQSMWVRRNRNELIVTESGERVLSTDPILTYYHFCNVYRELDRGTAYFHSHVLNMRYASSEKGEDSSWDEKLWLETVLWASYVYRQVNRIETFQALGGIPDIDEIEKFGHRAESHAQTVVFFTGAHQTTNVSNLLMRLRTYQGEDGVKVFRNTASKLYSAQSVKEAINILQSLKGIGVFFAWQIVCDLRESQCLHHLKSDDYCQLGPGAKKGLDAILGCGRKDYLQEAQKLVGIQEEAYRQLGLQFPYWQPRKLSIKEIEHFLCEMSKYDSIDSDGTGRSYKTRSRMDVKTPCPVCNTDKSESRCDTCFTFFCTECSPKGTESHASFLCTWCVKFNGLAPKHTPVSDSSPISSLSLMQEEVAVDRDTMYKGTRKSVSAPAEDSMEIVPTPFATGGKAEDAMDLTSKTPEAGVKSEDAMGLSIFHC